MKNAIKTSEESWIEQQMLEDKKRATDWEATNEAIEEQVARESYLQWLQDQEKQARQVWNHPSHPNQSKFKRLWNISLSAFPFSLVKLVPPAVLPQPPHPAALRTGDAGLPASAALPPLQSIQARLTLNPLSNLPLQLELRCFFPNPLHHVPQVCIFMYVFFAYANALSLLTNWFFLDFFSRSKSSVFCQLFPGVSLPKPGLQDSNAGDVSYCLW